MLKNMHVAIVLFISILIIFPFEPILANESWAPFSGYSSVNQNKTYNRFYFRKIEGVYSETDTYEHETQVYNAQFADYDGYWSSNHVL